jgi:uncharacterized protein (TIGR02145 family)
MKKILLIVAFVFGLFTQVAQAQTPKLKVGSNPTSLHSSAALEVQSTSQGFLPPRMNLNQISAIATPAEGLSVYCTDCSPKALLSFDGINWVNANGQQPIAPPSAPSAPVATAGVGSASVAFTAPTSTGSGAIVSYTVTSFPGGRTATGTASPIVVGNLTAGTAYTFVVRATNASGLTATSVQSNSVTPTAGVPQAPTALVATAALGQSASIAFTAPTNNGGSPITGYTVTSTPGGITASGTTSPIVVSGLTNGTAYTFTIVATNAQGNSVASAASNSLTPQASAPAAPTIGTATITATTASVAFTAPANNGGATITSYTVTSTPSGITASGTTSPIAVPGLNTGVAYTFTVTATNSAGTSIASTASNTVTATSAPSAPAAVAASALSGSSASVSFATPSANGSPITGYTITPSPATSPATFTGTSSPITVTGLTTGTAYTFSVTATNAVGTSTPGTTTFTPQNQVPGAPTGVQAAAGNAQATITFTAPTNNGGAAITGYTVTATPGGFTATGAASPLTVTGLTNGTSYTFTVVATNNVGNSVPSAPSNSIMPATTGTVIPAVLTTNNLNAAAAYSLRKINSAYNGSAIRVRRSNDNTEQNIGFAANGNLDEAALTAFVGSNSGFVTVWYDQSGNARNITQTTAANQPRIVNAGTIERMANGGNRATVRYTGVNGQMLSNNTAPLGNAGIVTINLVQVENTRIFNTAIRFSNGDNTRIHLPWQDGNTILDWKQAGKQWWEGRITTSRVVSLGTPMVFTYTHSSSTNNRSIRYNQGVRVGTTLDPNGGTPVLDRIEIGGTSINDNSMDGSIAEFIMLPVVPSESVLAALESNQMTYYSLSPIAGATSVTSAPTGVSAVAGNTAATVSFTPVSGATSYTVTSNPGNFTATGTSSPIQVNGLTNGTAYTFTVVATNTGGNSVASSPSNSVTPSAGAAAQTVSNAPANVTATAGINNATVAFTAPSNTGNSAITGYTVTSNPGGITATGTSSPITVNGLTPGTNYTFTVVATNSVGNSTPSAPSNVALVYNVPAQPVIGNITTTGLFASVPVTVNNNGSAIISYTATVNPGNITSTSMAQPVPVNLPSSGSYSVVVTATNIAGASVASIPVNITVAPISSPQTASNVVIPTSDGSTFTQMPGITPSTVISVGGTCPTSVTWQGFTYPTVNIGGQCWTARNMRSTPTVTGSSIRFNFFNNQANETAWLEGYYYTWDAAMNGSTTTRAQGICPTGWHVPNFAEWTYLLTVAGNDVNSMANSQITVNGAANLYNPAPGTPFTNSLGFNLAPAGWANENGTIFNQYFNGPEVFGGMNAFLWASDQASATDGLRVIVINGGNAVFSGRSKLRGHSVRCLKD